MQARKKWWIGTVHARKQDARAIRGVYRQRCGVSWLCSSGKEAGNERRSEYAVKEKTSNTLSCYCPLTRIDGGSAEEISEVFALINIASKLYTS